MTCLIVVVDIYFHSFHILTPIIVGIGDIFIPIF